MTRALPEARAMPHCSSRFRSAGSGSPEEIAHAVAFLASPQAAYITGHTLHVNGGMYMN